MKKFKYLLAFPLVALAAFMGTSCDDDEETVRIEPPTIEVGEVTLASVTESNAVVTVTPSSNTETWYWKCEESGGATASYTSVSGNEETQLSIPVKLDTDYTLTVYAENEQAKSEEVTKNFNLASAEVEGDLVTFEIKNLSAVSVDVEVTKNIKCTRYAIGAVAKYSDMDDTLVENYNKETFIESAQRSLNPDPNYPYQPYNTSDKNEVFTELTLLKGSAEENVNTGLVFSEGETYVVGIYALGANGEGTLYTQEFTVPEVNATEGQIDVTIDTDVTMTSVSANFSASSNCAKIITSIAHKSTLDNENFDGMSDEEKANFLATNTAQCPQPYAGEFSRQFQTEFSPNTEYVVWAVPVDAEGKVGKVTWKEGTTAGVSFTGTGEITAAAINQETWDKVDITLTVSNDVKKVRLLFLDENNYFMSHVGDDLEWIMTDAEKMSHFWTEKEVADNTSSVVFSESITIGGLGYYIKAVTIDAEGGISEVQDVVTLADSGNEKGIWQSMEEPVEEGITLDGTGEVGLTVTEESVDGMISVDFTVTQGANTQKAWYFRDGNSNSKDQAEEIAKDVFANYPEEIPARVKEITFGTSYREEYLNAPYNNWPGDLLIIVTLDNNGKLKVAKVYEAGTGNVTE